MDFRRIARWVVNIGSLIVAVTALPEFGALIPATALPAIAGVVAIVNIILTVIRNWVAGQAVFTFSR